MKNAKRDKEKEKKNEGNQEYEKHKGHEMIKLKREVVLNDKKHPLLSYKQNFYYCKDCKKKICYTEIWKKEEKNLTTIEKI